MPADIFTLKNIAVVCGIALLLLLGHFFPRRRIYAIFLALLAGAGAAFSFFTPETSEPITPAERQVRAVQQQLVAAWHAKHQKAIDALDHNWKQYHLVLSDFAAEAISLEEAQSRLERIDRNQTETVERLNAAEPPEGLLPENYALVLAVLQKTRAYATAQQRTIHMCALSADPEQQLYDSPAEQSRGLQEIMLREAPHGLFTANEISSLRNNVHLPD